MKPIVEDCETLKCNDNYSYLKKPHTSLFSGPHNRARITSITSRMAQYKGAASEAGRAMQIMKRREKELEEMEQKKRKLEESLKINKIENKFAVHYDAVEQQLKVESQLVLL